MEGCPAALIEGPCEILMWFFALPGMKTSCRRWHSLPRGWHSWGTLAGLAWSQSSLCAVPPKSWDHKGVPLLQQPLGQTGPGRYSGIKWHRRGWSPAWLPSLPPKSGWAGQRQESRGGWAVWGWGGKLCKSLQDAGEIGALLGASAWHLVLISLDRLKHSHQSILKLQFVGCWKSTIGSPKQLSCRHFGLEHKIR